MVTMSQTVGRVPWTAELYARAVAGAVLPGFIWGSGDTLPQHALRRAGVRFTAEAIAAYRDVCGGTGPGIPPAMPHLPGFPLTLQMMTARDFPMPALGMVHLSNRIEVLGALDPAATYDLEVALENPREHKRGVVFDVSTVLLLDEEPVWREVSTYLSRGSHLADAGPAQDGPRWPDPPATTADVTLLIPENIGRRYAGVSGDRNPIHMHALGAKAFGFRAAIAHGMWTLARSLAEIEDELPESYTVTAGFFKPVLLPTQATLRIARGDGTWTMWVVTGETLHAAITVS